MILIAQNAGVLVGALFAVALRAAGAVGVVQPSADLRMIHEVRRKPRRHGNALASEKRGVACEVRLVAAENAVGELGQRSQRRLAAQELVDELGALLVLLVL